MCTDNTILRTSLHFYHFLLTYFYTNVAMVLTLITNYHGNSFLFNMIMGPENHLRVWYLTLKLVRN